MSNNVTLGIEGIARRNFNKNFREYTIILKKFFSFLTVSSIFIGLTSLFKTYMTFVFLGMNPNILICLASFLVTFSAYSINKLSDLKEDAVNMPERLRFLAGRQKLVKSYSLGAYILSALIALADAPLAVPIAFVPIVSNLIYSSKLLPGVPRFKDIPLMKNVFVAGCWAIYTTSITSIHMTDAAKLTVIGVFYFIFIKSFINTVIYDIRDIKGDKENGVITIPVLLGTKVTTIVLFILNSSLLSIVALSDGLIRLITLSMVLYGYAYILYFRVRRDPQTLDFFVDGEWMHVFGLLMLLKGLI